MITIEKNGFGNLEECGRVSHEAQGSGESSLELLGRFGGFEHIMDGKSVN